MTEVTCVLPLGNKLGEGIIWDDRNQVLWWVDIASPSAIHRYNPVSKKHDYWPQPEMVSAVSCRRDGTLLVASHHGLNVFNPQNQHLFKIADLGTEENLNRSNDGKTDAAGRFWFGTMRNNLSPENEPIPINISAGTLYRVGSNMIPTPMLRNIGIINALCWSPDARTMYVGDSLTDTIYAYDFDLELGAMANPRVFSRITNHGTPDGSCIDSQGYIWSARWEGGCVLRLAPNGTIDRVLNVPASRVTCCCFGGRDLDTLYITTSCLNLNETTQRHEPHAGGLFAATPGVRGTPHPIFAG